MNKYYVHDGVFHGDDVACVALAEIFFGPGEVIRTRGKEVLAAAIEDRNSFVFDVGGVHDEGKLSFDHHQDRSGNKASIGRFVDYLENTNLEAVKKKLMHKQFAVEIIQDFRTEIANELDAHDLGVQAPVGNMTLPKVISGFNEVDAYSKEQDDAFVDAVVFMKGVVLRFIKQKSRHYVTQDQVEKAIEQQKDSVVLVLDEAGLPWKEIMIKDPTKIGSFHFVVFESGDSWRLQAVPDPRDVTATSMRTKVPVDATLMEGNVFTHPVGFISGWVSKKVAIEAGKVIVSR